MEVKKSDSNIKVAKEIILKTFYFLEEESYYTPDIQIVHDDTFLESVDVEYIHQIKRRKVCISYTKGKVYGDIKYTFSASITRMPYNGIEDFFSLSNYLESIGKDFNTSLINEFDENKAEEILKKITAALKEHASKIMEGSLWLETYYPRKD